MLNLTKRNQHLGIWSLAFALIIRWVFSVFPHLCEIIYGQILFPSIRWILDYTFGILPFPSFYIFFIFLVVALYKSLKRIQLLWQNPLKKIAYVLNFWSWIFVAFLLVWGFNYQRPEIADRLNFKPIQIKKNGYDRMIQESLRKINSIQYIDISFDSTSIDMDLIELRRSQNAFLNNLGYVPAGNVQLKSLKPKGIFSRVGISGMYLPWVGQGNVDDCLSNLEKPFISAHEMAHAYGVTNEGEASFVAYMTCWASKNDLYRYSAEIYLLRNLLYRVKNRNESQFNLWMNQIPPKVKSDIEKIKKHRKKYPNFIPDFSDQLNNTYLKSQGIESGSRSYGELIELIYNWEYERR